MDDDEDNTLVAVQNYPRGRVERQPVESKEQVEKLPDNFHNSREWLKAQPRLKARWLKAQPRSKARRRFEKRRRQFHRYLKRYKEYLRPDSKAMKLMKDTSFKFNKLGQVPGVLVGDSFDYRAEMCVVGLHGAIQKGISSVKQGRTMIASSVVVSGGYEDDVDCGDKIIYTGEGGRDCKGGQQKEDQELKGGNLALVKSYFGRTPVRVIRGHASGRTKQEIFGRIENKNTKKKYSYDGLYTINDWKFEEGSNGYKVFKFMLTREPGQRPLDMTRLVSGVRGRRR